MNFEEPLPEGFSPKDAIWSICLNPRYTCHTFVPHTVGTHSYVMALVLHAILAEPWRSKIGFTALIHDFTEAYLNDVCAPVKWLLPDYKLIEQRIWMNSIAPALDVDPALISDPVLETIDKAMWYIEDKIFCEAQFAKKPFDVDRFVNNYNPHAPSARVVIMDDTMGINAMIRIWLYKLVQRIAEIRPDYLRTQDMYELAPVIDQLPDKIRVHLLNGVTFTEFNSFFHVAHASYKEMAAKESV
jgi:hypothetical protein